MRASLSAALWEGWQYTSVQISTAAVLALTEVGSRPPPPPPPSPGPVARAAEMAGESSGGPLTAAAAMRQGILEQQADVSIREEEAGVVPELEIPVVLEVAFLLPFAAAAAPSAPSGPTAPPVRSRQRHQALKTETRPSAAATLTCR